ncbi:DUF3224 domain-containing protein [Myxococcota bacterium]|nr:DUF3224 domain-containing protein [Myxococcota bacterium]
MIVTGLFEITMSGEPPFDVVDGVSLARARFDKRFRGPLTATSKVEMLAAHTAVKGSAGYVAVERITGSIDGRAGSFVVMHLGMMERGADSLVIRIVPDSGTGALAGIRGTMNIRIIDGQHHYELDHSFGE